MESFGPVFENGNILQSLVELDVSHNYLSGEIPTHFESRLSKAYFHGNVNMSLNDTSFEHFSLTR